MNSPEDLAAQQKQTQQAFALGNTMTNGNITTAQGYQDYQNARKALGDNAVDTTAAMNPGVASAAKGVTDFGSMSADEIAKRNLEGTDKSGQLATQGTLNQQSQGLGGPQDAGMQAAIANRQGKIYGSSLNAISQQAQMNSKLQQAQNQSAAMAGMASVEDLKTQAANTQLVKYQNDQAKRNSVLNSVLGLAGAITGGIIGKGSPAAMSAGSALASGAGRTLEGGGGNTSVRALDSGGQGSAGYFGGGH